MPWYFNRNINRNRNRIIFRNFDNHFDRIRFINMNWFRYADGNMDWDIDRNVNWYNLRHFNSNRNFMWYFNRYFTRNIYRHFNWYLNWFMNWHLNMYFDRYFDRYIDRYIDRYFIRHRHFNINKNRDFNYLRNIYWN